MSHSTLILIISLAARSVFATDCNTNCEGHFNQWYQSPDLLRCQAEREIACKTGLTNCDTFRVPVFAEGYYAAIETVQLANKKTGWPKDANDCHSAMDNVATAGSAVSAGKFAYTAYQIGIKAASAAAVAGVWTAAAVEGAKALVHCACKHARYEDKDENAPQAGPTNDRYQVSMFNNGWSLWRGPNNPGNRQTLYQKTLSGVGGSYKRKVSTTFSSQARTLTEVVCNEGTFWKIGQGEKSSAEAADEMRTRHWTQCLFRTINYAGNEPDVSDRWFASVSKGYAWGLRTGPTKEKERVFQEAVNKVGGTWDSRKQGRFSTHRPTRTHVSCEARPQTISPGLQSSDSVLFITAGTGYESVRRAIDTVEKKYRDYRCLFDVSDVGFGPHPD